MATIRLISEQEATGKVKEVYEQIQKAFGLPFVPNLFKAMAHNPDLLEANRGRVGMIMGRGRLDRKTKEMIAVAVSATNNCEYCVNAHTAALNRMGVTDPELLELMAVVDLFNGFNRFADGLRIESDLKPE
jgi:AhpD family alkylhydroperoxidase